MESALRRRRFRPLFVVDLGVPNDVEPAAAELEEVFGYDLDDLERVATAARSGRDAAAAAAWAIVDAEVASLIRNRAERAAVPALAALRRHFEAARNEVLGDAGRPEAVRATELLLNRLLDEPSRALRAMAAAPGGRKEIEAAERLLSRLFDLEHEVGPSDSGQADSGRSDSGRT